MSCEKLLELYGSNSPCCGKPRRIVQSRESGYVSQNCTCCGRPYPISLREAPILSCGICEAQLRPICNPLTGNHSYRCTCYNDYIGLYELVPYWSHLFQYYGLAIDSDRKRHKRRRAR